MTATAADLAALERLIGALPKEKIEELANLPGVKERLGKWQPNPGPQTEAYYSLADCLLYGGEPGGGKSQLILGLAFNCHERSLVMRRQYSDLDRIIEDALTIHGSRRFQRLAAAAAADQRQAGHQLPRRPAHWR
jgi:hypothetical protein